MWNLDLSAVTEAMASASATVDQFANSALNLDNLQEENDEGSSGGQLGKEGSVEWREDYDHHRKPERVESPIQSVQRPTEVEVESPQVEATTQQAPLQNTSTGALRVQNKVQKPKPALKPLKSGGIKSKGKKGVTKDAMHDMQSSIDGGSLVQSPTADGASPSREQVLESRVMALEREKETLSKTASDLEKAVKDMGNKDRKKTMEVEEMKIAKAVLTSDLSKLTDEVKQKDATIDDLKEKLRGLTEKTRDVMKSYSQSKEKVKALESSEEAALVAKNVISTKDAEILSLKLKLENLDTIIAEQKQAAASSAEHKLKVKKEKSADLETISLLTERVQTLEAELNKATTATAGLAEEASKAQADHDHTKNALTALQIEFKEARNKFDEEIAATLSNHEAILVEKESELDNLRMKLGTENDAVTQHEEYKKRAQLALKKANSSASELNAKIMNLQSDVEGHEATISTLEAALANEQEKRIAIENAAEDIKTKYSTMSEDLLLARKTADQSKVEIRELQEANTALSEACEQLEAAVSTKSSLIEENMAELAQLKAALEDSRIGSQSDATLAAEGPAISRDGMDESEATNDLGGDGLDNARSGSLDSTDNATRKQSGTEGDTEAMEIPRKTASPDQLYYVQTLTAELEELRRENGQKSMQITEAKMHMTQQLEENQTLQERVEELQNFLNRSKKSTDSEAVTNMEYLKNCVWRFMATTEMSEKKRLFPVISTILNFTSLEREQIYISLQEMEAGATIDIAASISNSVSTLFG